MLTFLQKPVYQLAIIQLLSVLVIIIYRPNDVNSSWTVVGLFYVLFIMLNSVFIWSAPRVWVYFFTSLGLSMVYMLLAYFVVSLFNELMKIKGSGESSMIFLVIIYHPFSLLIVLAVKWLYTRFV